MKWKEFLIKHRKIIIVIIILVLFPKPSDEFSTGSGGFEKNCICFGIKSPLNPLGFFSGGGYQLFCYGINIYCESYSIPVKGACEILKNNSCSISTKSIAVKSYDADKNGIINDDGDTLLAYCQNYKSIITDSDCKNFCGC